MHIAGEGRSGDDGFRKMAENARLRDGVDRPDDLPRHDRRAVAQKVLLQKLVRVNKEIPQAQIHFPVAEPCVQERRRTFHDSGDQRCNRRAADAHCGESEFAENEDVV